MLERLSSSKFLPSRLRYRQCTFDYPEHAVDGISSLDRILQSESHICVFAVLWYSWCLVCIQWNCQVRRATRPLLSSIIPLLNGASSFVNQSVATANALAYVETDGTVVMKGDNTTWLAAGENRDR